MTDSNHEVVAAGSPRVLAVIVAYNHPDVLERCLSSLDAQTRPVDGVLIVDNSEPTPLDITLLGLAIADRTRVLRSGSNLGPAGGFALGVATFREEGSWTHAWLMDDDCYPMPESLALLVQRAITIRAGSVVYPRAFNESTGAPSSYPAWSHAPLIDRLAVELGGLPRADLFWWVEDTEYLQHRLPRAGVVVDHADGAQIVFDQPRRVGQKPAWKYYYEVRNTVWYRIHVQRGGFSALPKLTRTLARLSGSALRGSDRRVKCGMLVRGLADGLRGRLGRSIQPPA